MADAGKKQEQLVESIAVGVQAKLAPSLKAIAEQTARLEVLLNGVTARLAVVEATVGGGAAPKRAVRAAAPGAKPADKKADVSKVANTLLYFRFIMGTDRDGAREIYGTPENVAAVETLDGVAKQSREKDPDAWWSAAANAMWRTQLTEQQKETIKTEFNAWKEERDRAAAGGVLTEEAGV
jgi:hypothetical protein